MKESDGASLPPGWQHVRLDEVAEVRLGRQRSPSRATGLNMVPYLRAANVTWDGLDLSDVKTMDFSPAEQSVYRLRAGDVVLSEASGSANEVGKPAIWADNIEGCCFQNTLIRVRARAPEMSTYLHRHFLADAITGRFGQESRGVGIHHLGAEAMSGWQVRIAPEAEGRRIVDAVDSSLSRITETENLLARVERNLKRYRASVLKAAVEGRLVPTEAELSRAEKRDYEPASVLLKRILAERRRRWEEAELERMRARGKAPRDDKWRTKYVAPAPPRPREGAVLPDGWCWASVDMLADLKGGITKGQQRKPDDVLRDVPYLRVANVQRGNIDLSVIKTIAATEDEIEELRLSPGDVLFNEGGDRDKLGRGWVWNGELPECIHQNHVFRARIFTPDLTPKFLSWYGNAVGQDYFFQEGKQTTNLASINLTKLRNLPVPIPPVAEQARIATEVERLLSLADGAFLVAEHSTLRCARLRQSILKWAFEGKLVDQDPSDEPASALLARIRTEKESAASSATPRRKRKA